MKVEIWRKRSVVALLLSVLLLAVGALYSCGGGGGGETAAPVRYSVGGTVNGVWPTGGVVLQNNGIDDLMITSHGTFTFSTQLASSSTYSITVKTPPAGQSCAVNNGAGTVSGSDITNISVVCSLSSADLAAMIANGMNKLTGAITPTPISGSNSGVDYTITPQGYSFCIPSNLYSSPTQSPAAGYTVFGCVNNVSAIITTPTSTQATLRLTMPVYGQANIDWHYIISGSCKGYGSLSTAQVDIAATIADVAGGAKQVVSVDSVTLTYAPAALSFGANDSLVNAVLTVVEPQVISQVQSEVENAIKQQLGSMIPTIPLFIPN